LLPDAEHFLVVSQNNIQWQPQAPFTLDVAEFEEAIARAEIAKQDSNLDNLRQEWEKAIACSQTEKTPITLGFQHLRSQSLTRGAIVFPGLLGCFIGWKQTFNPQFL
jgi:hypothetical protein